MEDEKGGKDVRPKHQLGKAHGIELRERIALMVEKALQEDSGMTISSVARHFQVDRKTASKYHAKWKMDRKSNIDYTKEDMIAKSQLKPFSVRPKTNKFDIISEFKGEKNWNRISTLIANLQTQFVPQYTASDIVRVLNKFNESGRFGIDLLDNVNRRQVAKKNPAKSPAEYAVAELLRSEPWWEGIMLVIGSWCRKKDPVSDPSDMRLSRVKDALMSTFVQRKEDPSSDFHAFIVDGDYDNFLLSEKEQKADLQKELPTDFWNQKTVAGKPCLCLDKRAFGHLEMENTFWQFLPDPATQFVVKNDKRLGKTIGNMIMNDSTLKTPESQIQFVVRLAAHDYVMLEYIKKHNYSVRQRTFGDDIMPAKKGHAFIPPGITYVNETPFLRVGDDRIEVHNLLSRTVEEAHRKLLPYPDKAGTRDDDQDIQGGVQMMVDKLVAIFGKSSYAEILHDLFGKNENPRYMQLDKLFSSDADDSYLYDREYVSRKERNIDPDYRLARAIYSALNVIWRVNDVSGTKTDMHGLDVAAHIWFIVHHCRGDPKWMEGNLKEMDGGKLQYGDPPQTDASFSGTKIDHEQWKKLGKVIRFKRENVLPIQISRNVLIPPRRGCTAQFVDGKYEDPSKVRVRAEPLRHPEEYRDYTQAKPIDEDYPGKMYREGMDKKIPVEKTCKRDTADVDHRKTIEKERITQDVTEPGSRVVIGCRQKRAWEYKPGERVRVALLGAKKWQNATIAEDPEAGDSKHDPWVSVVLDRDKAKYRVLISRIRPERSVVERQNEQAAKRHADNEKARMKYVDGRVAKREEKNTNMAPVRTALAKDPVALTRKFIAAIVKEKDPMKALKSKEDLSITDDEVVAIPSVYSSLLSSLPSSSSGSSAGRKAVKNK
eukprot:jgi/Mesvir1/26710/Mv20487-RA.1